METGGRTRFVERDAIRFVEASGDYVRLHADDGAYLVRMPISALEETWRDAGFVRVHRRYLVALRHVTELRAGRAAATLVVAGEELRSAAATPASCATCSPAAPAGPEAAGEPAGDRGRPRSWRLERVDRPQPAGPGRAGRGRRATALAELAEQTEVGEVLLRSLTRAQLLLAVRIFAVFGFLLLGLPALFASHPGLADYRVFGLPLPWLLLGGAIYPLLVLLGCSTCARPSATSGSSPSMERS